MGTDRSKVHVYRVEARKGGPPARREGLDALATAFAPEPADEEDAFSGFTLTNDLDEKEARCERGARPSQRDGHRGGVLGSSAGTSPAPKGERIPAAAREAPSPAANLHCARAALARPLPLRNMLAGDAPYSIPIVLALQFVLLLNAQT